MNLSALILAKNEQEMIGECIEQLNFADEVIVLDQNSTDKTKAIAKSLGATIIENYTGDFDEDRNRLKNTAKGEWLLYIDADERLSELTIDEIKSIISKQKIGTYYFPRKNIILGKWLRHGGWWPDFVPRLFYKKNLNVWRGKVHESPIFSGQKYYCKNYIEHQTARSIESMLEKTIKWAKIEASLYKEANFPKVNIFRVIKAMIREFINRYFFKLALLDGRIGLIQSFFQAYHQAIIMVYLWELQKNKK